LEEIINFFMSQNIEKNNPWFKLSFMRFKGYIFMGKVLLCTCHFATPSGDIRSIPITHNHGFLLNSSCILNPKHEVMGF
jgi:hypothetical protein